MRSRFVERGIKACPAPHSARRRQHRRNGEERSLLLCARGREPQRKLALRLACPAAARRNGSQWLRTSGLGSRHPDRGAATPDKLWSKRFLRALLRQPRRRSQAGESDAHNNRGCPTGRRSSARRAWDGAARSFSRFQILMARRPWPHMPMSTPPWRGNGGRDGNRSASWPRRLCAE